MTSEFDYGHTNFQYWENTAIFSFLCVGLYNNYVLLCNIDYDI